jgi:hypothetical protein
MRHESASSLAVRARARNRAATTAATCRLRERVSERRFDDLINVHRPQGESSAALRMTVGRSTKCGWRIVLPRNGGP